MKSLVSIALAGGLLLSSSVALADTAPLSASCSTSVTNATAAWHASATGGVAPYALLWSGDGSVNGSTSSDITANYSANGTFLGMLKVTDASSTVATTTCQAVVNYYTTATSTVTHQQVNARPTLVIGENGSFVANDMIVQSIGSSTFVANVWGITYTVTPPASFTMANLAVNDQVTLTGKISTSSPLAITAKTMRDLSLVRTSKNHGDDDKGAKWTYHFTASSHGNGKDNEHINIKGNFFGDLFAHLHF